MVDGFGNSHGDLWNPRHCTATGFVDWSCPCSRVADSAGRCLAFNFCFSLSQFCGFCHLIFVFHSHSFGGVLWQLLLAVVYGFAGVYMLMHPLLGLVTLTFVIAIFLLIEAGLETALYFTIRRKTNAGWVLFDALVTLVLAIMI